RCRRREAPVYCPGRGRWWSGNRGIVSRAANLVLGARSRLPNAASRLFRIGLAMNWRDFLPLANRLATAASEADWRTAMSRAYYAAFHVARHLFSDLNFAVPRADRAHQYLVFRLSNSGESSVEQVGRDLETLRRLRNRADYDETPPFTQPQAAAVRIAGSIIQGLDAAGHEPTRTAIRNTMI